MSQKRMIDNYDEVMVDRRVVQYYGGSDYCNWGYWTPETLTQAQASEKLVSRLLEMAPGVTGKVLDVACGLGASTGYLQRRFAPADVVGVNLSRRQLARAMRNAPGGGFAVMDAARLGFTPETFDILICVEAAFHFETREDFLREALRVLRPGGVLLMSDILLRPKLFTTSGNWYFPPSNQLPDPAALGGKLSDAGFADVSVVDATRECLGGFCDHMRRWPGEERLAGRISLGDYIYMSARCLTYRLTASRFVRYYVLAAARKP